MANRKLRNEEIPSDEFESGTEETASDGAGQSGDARGLSHIAEADEESLEELAETDQEYETETVVGVEDAGNHPKGLYGWVRTSADS
jgi:hypothetical protein